MKYTTTQRYFVVDNVSIISPDFNLSVRRRLLVIRKQSSTRLNSLGANIQTNKTNYFFTVWDDDHHYNRSNNNDEISIESNRIDNFAYTRESNEFRNFILGGVEILYFFSYLISNRGSDTRSNWCSSELVFIDVWE